MKTLKQQNCSNQVWLAEAYASANDALLTLPHVLGAQTSAVRRPVPSGRWGGLLGPARPQRTGEARTAMAGIVRAITYALPTDAINAGGDNSAIADIDFSVVKERTVGTRVRICVIQSSEL